MALPITPYQDLINQITFFCYYLRLKIQIKYSNLNDNEATKLSAKIASLITAFAPINNVGGTLSNVGQINDILNFIFESAAILKKSKKFNLTDREYLEITIDYFSPELIKKLIELN